MLPCSIYYNRVGVTGIICIAQVETSISNNLCCIFRFTGLEVPVKCKSRIMEIQRKKRCFGVGQEEVEYFEKSSWHRGHLTGS